MGNALDRIRRELEIEVERNADFSNDTTSEVPPESVDDDNFWQSLQQDSQNTAGASRDREYNNARFELQRYLEEPIIGIREDPLVFWAQANRFPNLRKIVTKYLCVMCTSVPTERLFSEAGNILNPKRNRLMPASLSGLLFMAGCEQEDWGIF